MEDYSLTCLRVKYSKAPYNMSQQDITQLFDGVRNASELKSLKKIVDLCCKLVSEIYCHDTKIKDAKILVGSLLETLVAHQADNLNDFTVRCYKDYSGWHFIIGENQL